MLRQKNWVEKQTQPARNSNTYIVRQTPLFQTKAQTHNHFHYSLVLHFVIQWRLITSEEVEAEVWLKFWSYIDIQRVTVILVIFFIWFVPFWKNCFQRKPLSPFSAPWNPIDLLNIGTCVLSISSNQKIEMKSNKRTWLFLKETESERKEW